jgi:hypothetical protein
LFVNFKHVTGAQEQQFLLLKQLSLSTIQDTLERLDDWHLKFSVFLVCTKVSDEFLTISEVGPFLPSLISHRYYYNDLAIISGILWCDEFAALFLEAFTANIWDPINSQMFEKYTAYYSKLLTLAQLSQIEDIQVHDLPAEIKRVYRVWTELLSNCG